MTFRERVAMRRKEQTRNLKKAVHIAALVVVAAISISMSRPAADTHIVEVNYVVQPGDTWWGIVERFREMDAEDRYVLEYKQELEQLNKGVDLCNLTPGQTLRIQYREKGERK